MENGSEHLDSIKRILDKMAARQQYHDEAFARFNAEMKLLLEAIAANSEYIRVLLRRENLAAGEAPR